MQRRYQLQGARCSRVRGTGRILLCAASLSNGRADEAGAHVCGIKGHLVSYEDFLAEAAKAMPAVAQLARITPGAPEVPIHGDVDEAPLRELLGRSDLHKPLDQAVAEMVRDFEALKAKGQLSDSDLGPPPASKL